MPAPLIRHTLSSKPVVYACSGCSDAGELADRVARRLMREGVADMSCLAGVGGQVRHLVAVAREAGRVVVIDGCPINCARKTLELAGVTRIDHVELHRLGLRKGACPVTEENVSLGVDAAKARLSTPPS